MWVPFIPYTLFYELLVHCDGYSCFIVSMNRSVDDGFKVNTQHHLVPVLATSIKVILKLWTFNLCCLFAIIYVCIVPKINDL